MTIFTSFPRVSDCLRAIPAPAALLVIAGVSFVSVPLAARLLGAGTTSAEAKPSNRTAHAQTGAIGLPASMPTYMPSLIGGAAPTTYAAPAPIASAGYAAGGGVIMGGSTSNGYSHPSNPGYPPPPAPPAPPHRHAGWHGTLDQRVDRRMTPATAPTYRHDLPPTIRPMMPQRIAPVQQSFAYARPFAPTPFFGGGMGGGFRSFGGGGRHR